MKKYFTKALAYNLLLALALTILLLLLVNWGLRIYTRHGQSVQVPDVRGKVASAAEDVLDQSHLDMEIMDSVFMPDKPPMAVIEQNPKPGTKVKAGRTIYLTINSSHAPLTEIPDLVGRSSYKYARIQLESMGFKLTEPVYRPDPHQDAVLEVLVNNKVVRPGTKIPKGTMVTLVLGDGLANQKITVPYLVGLRYEEALLKLKEEYQLAVGALVVNDDVRDTLRAFVYKQEPSYGDGHKIRVGEEVDLFLSREMPEDIEIHPEWYNLIPDTAKEP
ncbi:MAG: PASTA domain-containing protein [Chitinophagales bacterium]